MNKERIMFLVLIFLSLIGYTNIVSAGPSLCCEMQNDAIENTLIYFMYFLAGLLFVYIFFKIMFIFYDKKVERKNNKKSKENI